VVGVGGPGGRCMRSQPQLPWEEGMGGVLGSLWSGACRPSRPRQARRPSTLTIRAQSPGHSGADRSGAALRGPGWAQRATMAPKPHPHLSLFILTPGDLAAAAGAGEGTLKSTPLPSNEGIQAWGVLTLSLQAAGSPPTEEGPRQGRKVEQHILRRYSFLSKPI